MPETALTESAAESCSLRRRHILCQAGLGVQGGGDVRVQALDTGLTGMVRIFPSRKRQQRGDHDGGRGGRKGSIEPARDLQELSRQGGPVRVLDGLGFDIHERDFVSIIGPSGCGKTIVFNIVAGLLEPDSGSMMFRREPVAGLRAGSAA